MTESLNKEKEPYRIKIFAIREIRKNGLPLVADDDEPLLHFPPDFVSGHKDDFPKQGEVLSGEKILKILFAIILAFRDYCKVGDKNYIEALIAETRKATRTRTPGDNTGRSHKTVCLVNNAASMIGLTHIIKNEEYYTIVEVKEKIPPIREKKNRSKKQRV